MFMANKGYHNWQQARSSNFIEND